MTVLIGSLCFWRADTVVWTQNAIHMKPPLFCSWSAPDLHLRNLCSVIQSVIVGNGLLDVYQLSLGAGHQTSPPCFLTTGSSSRIQPVLIGSRGDYTQTILGFGLLHAFVIPDHFKSCREHWACQAVSGVQTGPSPAAPSACTFCSSSAAVALLDSNNWSTAHRS